MSKDNETQLQVTNSYSSIIRLSGSSKTGCAKCDAKKLPTCICSKSASEENESEDKKSASIEKTKNIDSMQRACVPSTSSLASLEETDKENTVLILLGSQKEFKFKFTLKPNVKLTDVEALLEQFIKELVNNLDVNINVIELGKKLGIYYDNTQINTLTITIKNPEHFIEFFCRLREKDLIVIKQDQAQEIDNIILNENCQSFNPSPFSITLSPFKGT